MQRRQTLSRWTLTAGLLLLGGALSWAIKLCIIISTNGRIIDTGAAAVFMTMGMLLLVTGSTGIGHRLAINRAVWVRILAIVLSPLLCFVTLLLLGLLTNPLFQNSKVWYAQQEAPIGLAVLLFIPLGIMLYKNRYIAIGPEKQPDFTRITSSGFPEKKQKRGIRNIVKWAGITLLLLVATVAVTTASRQHLTYEAPYPDIIASTDTTIIAKGKNIALFQKGCVHCHSPVNNVDSMLKIGGEPSLAGARKFETPFGIFFTPNLTPDVKTGIGTMTDKEIARVLRYGVKKNGEAVLPFMQGLNMSDEEMTALISYLRSLEPISNKVPGNEFNLLGRFAKAFMVKPAVPQSVASLGKK